MTCLSSSSSPGRLDYLEAVYKPIVDSWEIFAGGEGPLKLLDKGPK